MKQKITLADVSRCTGCSACLSVCPKKCITMEEDGEGFLQPKINKSKCINCHKCEHFCPILTHGDAPYDYETTAFAALNIDELIRKESSSGGVFFALAKWCISQGGVVFGARWNDNWEVVHDYTDNIEGIKYFMKSKYVQSRIGKTYIQAKDFLNEGRWVLYSGTPCQLAGLRSVLGKMYEKLIQVDLICHGIPGPGVWRKYLKSYYPKEKILSINMRDKALDWKNFQFHVITDHRDSVKEHMQDPYMLGFLNNAILRRSCYQCHFRQYHRPSDLTIADYWGVEQLCPEMYERSGTSIVFCHSEKGRFILNQINHTLAQIPQTKENAICFNNAMEVSPTLTNKRKWFFRFLRISSSFKLSSSLVFKDTLPVRAMRKMKSLLTDNTKNRSNIWW